jgi:hypothetical protein
MATTPFPGALTPVLLAQQLIEAQAALKQWESYCDSLKAQLTQLHNEGTVPTEILVPGYSIKLTPGRVTVVLEDEVKARIADIQEEAIKEGKGFRKQGDPFWVVRTVRAKP